MRNVAGTSLWLGNVGDASDLRAVFAQDILAMVDLASNEPPARVTRDLVYLRFPLLDGADNPAWLLRAAIGSVAGLIRADVSTLVYCSAGLSRTPAIAAAGLAAARGITPDEALVLVTKNGPHDRSPALWREVVRQGDRGDGKTPLS